jgi:hypothetical protein
VTVVVVPLLVDVQVAAKVLLSPSLAIPLSAVTSLAGELVDVGAVVEDAAGADVEVDEPDEEVVVVPGAALPPPQAARAIPSPAIPVRAATRRVSRDELTGDIPYLLRESPRQRRWRDASDTS